MSHIVCTGKTGSLGQFLPQTVVGLKSRLESSTDKKILELKSLPEVPHTLLNFAALTSVESCEKDPALAVELNVNGALKWKEACDAVGVKNFIQISTGHVFKPTPVLEFLDPLRRTDATAVYGRTKSEAERKLIEKPGNAHLTIIRIFSVVSEHLRAGFLYPELIKRAVSRNLSPIRGYKNVRDFIDASTAIQSIVSFSGMAKTLNSPSILHICSGSPKSVQDLALEVFKKYGYQEEELVEMFPPTDEKANYLVSKPTKV